MTINNFRGTPLSNFFGAPVEYDGQLYPSAENAYQAAKTEDQEERKNLVSMAPVMAKKWGREIGLRKNWEAMKLSVMRTILEDKFGCSPVAEYLASTSPHMLVEGNNWGDTYWGAVWVQKRELPSRPGWKTWESEPGFSNLCLVGENHLGILLMEIREELI